MLSHISEPADRDIRTVLLVFSMALSICNISSTWQKVVTHSLFAMFDHELFRKLWIIVVVGMLRTLTDGQELSVLRCVLDDGLGWVL